jgi:serine/threonine-protein kinase
MDARAASAPPHPDEGAFSVLKGRYRLGAILGRGAMGDVYAGWDLQLERPVAVKVLRPDLGTDPSARRRFEAEAVAGAKVVHPNLVMVLDRGHEAGSSFLVMERLPGTTLHDRLAAGPLSTDEALALAHQLLSAIGAAHDAGIVHRDIKPGNVLTTERGDWKLGDFGIAKDVERSLGQETSTGIVFGTPAYLAPERLAGASASVSSDLYAVGVVLFEALTGQRPSDPEDGDRPAGDDPAARLQRRRPDVPARLAAGVGRALAPAPAERFPSARAMADALASAVAVRRLSDATEPLAAGTIRLRVAPASSAPASSAPPTSAPPTSAPPTSTPAPSSPPTGAPSASEPGPITVAGRRPVASWTVAMLIALSVIVAGVSAAARSGGGSAHPAAHAPTPSASTPVWARAAALQHELDELSRLVRR